MPINNDIEATHLTVKKIFTDYLIKKQLRKTKERFNILHEIYSNHHHFDISELYQLMKNKKYRISRATLYNNLNMLIDAGLIIKHQFGKNLSQYERAYKNKQHDHIICSDCNKVFEFCDPRIMEIQNSTEKGFHLKVTHHSLIFYAKCQLLNNNTPCKYKI